MNYNELQQITSKYDCNPMGYNRNTLFHCTKRKNLRKIFKHGLKPSMPEKITKSIEGVYLSKLPFDWMHYVTNETTVAGAMIEIDVEGLELEKDNGICPYSWEHHPAYFYTATISVERFVSISISTDEKPYSFEKILPERYKTLI